jgi:ABC-type Zn2+ transport system substrate-binding protein/surface adhesin
MKRFLVLLLTLGILVVADPTTLLSQEKEKDKDEKKDKDKDKDEKKDDDKKNDDKKKNDDDGDSGSGAADRLFNLTEGG